MRAYSLGILVYLAASTVPAGAQEDPGEVTDITDISLDELLNADVETAARVPQTLREVPGVITVITREEIMDSGARDLEDVLLLVPGFMRGVDVGGITGIGVRGNWGHEGKVLLLMDGQQMNETLYSTNQLGNHYPIDHIERIEIIRGPGSAIYGGFAELAVINIITRGADELNGFAAYGHAGLMSDTYGHANLSLAAGQSAGDIKFSLATLFGRGHRSNAPYTDFYGDTFNLTDHQLNPLFMNVGLQWKDLTLRFIYDQYRADERDALGENETEAFPQRFTGYYGEVAYKWKASSKLSVTPSLTYKRQLPWRVVDQDSVSFYDKTARRVTGGLAANYEATTAINVLGGAELYQDHAFLNQPSIPDTLHTQFGTSDSVSYVNFALYAQGLLKHKIANVTAGARLENHSEFGSSFVPRVAVTKVLQPFHFKLLYAQAFRAPGFENINLAPDPTVPMRPERTHSLEGEAGYSIDAHNFVAVNAFYTRINRPIVYFINADGSEGYQNFSRTGTAGVELDYRLRYKWGYFTVNYSYYRAVDNEVPVYAVDRHPELLLGMPGHKVTLHGAWKAWKNLRIAPSVVFTSGPYAYGLPGDGMGVGTLQHADPLVLTNLFISYRDLGVKGLEAGIGGYNLLDVKNEYFQPYDGGHAQMRGASRQLLLRVGFTQPF